MSNYNLRIQCFKVTPYTLGEQMLLNVEQIIPMKDAEEYSINMAEKTQEDITSHEESITRHSIRFEFWGKLIANLNQKSSLYQNISPTKYNWISTGSGMRGVGFNFAASKKYGRCEIYIDRGEFAENKKIFDLLFQEKDQIEEKFGGSLVWERLDEKRASRIKYELDTVNVFNKEDWSEMIEFMTSGMIRFEKVFQNRINKINALLKR